MAAPCEREHVRIRVNYSHCKTFQASKRWTLIFFSECPTIEDVGKKLIANLGHDFQPEICNEIGSLSTSTPSSGRSADESFSTRSYSVNKTAGTLSNNCQIWLDGYWLPDYENSKILRDNDEITVKTVSTHSESHCSEDSLSLKAGEGKRHQRKRKSPNQVDQEETSGETNEEGSSESKKQKVSTDSDDGFEFMHQQSSRVGSNISKPTGKEKKKIVSEILYEGKDGEEAKDRTAGAAAATVSDGVNEEVAVESSKKKKKKKKKSEGENCMTNAEIDRKKDVQGDCQEEQLSSGAGDNISRHEKTLTLTPEKTELKILEINSSLKDVAISNNEKNVKTKASTPKAASSSVNKVHQSSGAALSEGKAEKVKTKDEKKISEKESPAKPAGMPWSKQATEYFQSLIDSRIEQIESGAASDNAKSVKTAKSLLVKKSPAKSFNPVETALSILNSDLFPDVNILLPADCPQATDEDLHLGSRDAKNVVGPGTDSLSPRGSLTMRPVPGEVCLQQPDDVFQEPEGKKRRRRRKNRNNKKDENNSQNIEQPTIDVSNTSPVFRLKLAPHLQPSPISHVLFDDDDDNDSLSGNHNEDGDDASYKVVYEPPTSESDGKCIVHLKNEPIASNNTGGNIKGAGNNHSLNGGKESLGEGTKSKSVLNGKTNTANVESYLGADRKVKKECGKPGQPSSFVSADDKFESLLSSTSRVPGTPSVAEDKKRKKEYTEQRNKVASVAMGASAPPVGMPEPEIQVDVTKVAQQLMATLKAKSPPASSRLQTLSKQIDRVRFSASANKATAPPTRQDIEEGFVQLPEIPCPAHIEMGSFPDLSELPDIGDIIAYKILELSDDYSPVISDYKKAQVIHVDTASIPPQIELFGADVATKRQGRFELDPEADDSDDPSRYITTVFWPNLREAKLISKFD